jgi:hypothetical protein
MFVERSAPLARLGLALGAVCGLIFGLAQQSRGAHFISHDVWSAFIAWIVALTVFVFPFRASVWSLNSSSFVSDTSFMPEPRRCPCTDDVPTIDGSDDTLAGNRAACTPL